MLLSVWKKTVALSISLPLLYLGVYGSVPGFSSIEIDILQATAQISKKGHFPK